MTGGSTSHASRALAARDEQALADLLTDDDTARRRDAALALVDVAADGGLDPATEAALGDRVHDADADVRQFAVEALGQAGVGGDAIDVALEDDEQWVRAEAVVARSRLGGPDAERRLVDCLEDESGWVRRNALIALQKLDALSEDLLLSRLKTDPESQVREYAAEYLGENADDVAECVTVLAAVLARDPDPFVRLKAAESLGELGTDRAIDALETQGLTDPSEDVERTAKRALSVARGREVEPRVGGDVNPPTCGSETQRQQPTTTDVLVPDAEDVVPESDTDH